MRLRVAALLIALVSMTAAAQTTTLQALRDQSRPLLIFAPGNDPRLQQQLSDLAHQPAELRDRDMRVVLLVRGNGPVTQGSSLPLASFTPAEQEHARRKFHVAPDEFAAILVGKDGGEKLRSSSPLPWQRLSSTIDSMPMRRDEMHGKR
ncbi:DUF4174 domain-containing protein [Terriglobus aquaticus]|uniref:DUF4174 domain-containing protein n=1 Tax=Terriglobus aquaticus TaxID=940139 RepID=A0ABW9KM33_9BACT|nr:DUF4174 domain-containing protein [Terriglobus aquaticus]